MTDSGDSADQPNEPAVARRTLDRARFFVARAEEADPNLERAALEDNIAAAIVFGRSVTFHVQKQYAHAVGFREWWAEQQGRMGADPVMRFFLEQRNIELKIGPAGVRRVVSMEIAESVGLTTSVTVSVVRGQPWYRRSPRILFSDLRRRLWGPVARRRHRRAEERARRERAAVAAASSSRITADVVFFHDAAFGDRPALELLREYLAKLAAILEETESRFGA